MSHGPKLGYRAGYEHGKAKGKMDERALAVAFLRKVLPPGCEGAVEALEKGEHEKA